MYNLSLIKKFGLNVILDSKVIENKIHIENSNIILTYNGPSCFYNFKSHYKLKLKQLIEGSSLRSTIIDSENDEVIWALVSLYDDTYNPINIVDDFNYISLGEILRKQLYCVKKLHRCITFDINEDEYFYYLLQGNEPIIKKENYVFYN